MHVGTSCIIYVYRFTYVDSTYWRRALVCSSDPLVSYDIHPSERNFMIFVFVFTYSAHSASLRDAEIGFSWWPRNNHRRRSFYAMCKTKRRCLKIKISLVLGKYDIIGSGPPLCLDIFACAVKLVRVSSTSDISDRKGFCSMSTRHCRVYVKKWFR